MTHLRRLPRPARRYVPEELGFQRTREALEHAKVLLTEAVSSTAELEHWVRHRWEVEAGMQEALLLARLDFADQVTDGSRREWLDDLHQDLGAVKLELDHRLDERYLGSPARDALDGALRAAVEGPLLIRRRTWRESNLALLERLQQLQLEYIHLVGHLRLTWVGRPATLAELGNQLAGVDPLARRRAWEARAAALAASRPELEDLLDEVLALREQVSRNADCEDWNGYLALLGRDSLPAMEDDGSARTSGCAPWDHPQGCPVGGQLGDLDADSLLDDLLEALETGHPEHAASLAWLRSHRLLDLRDKPGKFELDLCAWLPERRLPYVRMNSHRLADDLCPLLRLIHAAHRVWTARAATPRLEMVVEVEPEDVCWAAEVADQLLSSRLFDSKVLAATREQLRRRRQQELEEARRLERWAWWLHANPGSPRGLRRLQWRHECGGGAPADPAAVEDTLFLEAGFFLPEWGPASPTLVLEEGWRGML